MRNPFLILITLAIALLSLAEPASAESRFEAELTGPYVNGVLTPTPAAGDTVTFRSAYNHALDPAHVDITCTSGFEATASPPFFATFELAAAPGDVCQVDLIATRGHRPILLDTLTFNVT